MRGRWLINYMLKWPSYLKYQLRISKRPLLLIIMITERCNSRCVMCNFWKNKDKKDELTPEEIREVLKSPIMRDLQHIALTGGEIFMREDVDQIIDVIYDTTGIRPTIGTNGLCVERLDSLLSSRKEKIGGVMISIDGVGRVHDRIRGNGTFKRSMQSIKLLKEKYGIKPTINMTVSRYNYDNLIKTYNLFRDCVFTYKVAKASRFHFGNNEDMDFIINRRQAERFFKAAEKIKDKNLYDVFLEEWVMEDKRPSPCYAGVSSIIMNPDGSIQPCLHKPQFGNIRQFPIDRILISKGADAFRKSHKNCQDCYERCAVDTFGIDLPKWVLKKKIKENCLVKRPA